MSYMYMPGATAVGITFDQGVVFASERRIAYGNFLVSKNTKKTFQITKYVGAACAGLVADMQLLSLQISALAKIRRLVSYFCCTVSQNCNEMYIGWMSSFGLSPEIAMLIAIGEIVPGILLIVGVLSRLSSGILAAIMVSAIFIVKDPAIITGDKGIEFDLILLAGALVLVIAGPGRISLAHIAKKIPRPAH